MIPSSTLWGLALEEWKGASPRAMRVLWCGVLLLIILSAAVMGAGACFAPSRP
jgi:L-rhamnose-H+ transport protein